MNGHILIIDDEEPLRKLLSRIISLEGFTVLQAGTLAQAEQLLKVHPILVILCDVRLPDGNGVDFIQTVKKKYPGAEIILLTAYGNIADGVKAIKYGAFDYITKADDNDRIIPLLYQAMDKATLQQQAAIKVTNQSKYDDHSIIGNSVRIKTAIQLVHKLSATDTTVLLLGETGTGKEVFANLIHQNSKRKQFPMIAINCSAFNKELLEGELFGHKAGAFTGANKDKKGLIEMAAGGTLFLDEIGELHIDLQAKLLRFLENGEFIKLGDTRVSAANVRVIAATNRPLKTEVEEGRFREDLYYRLNVFTLELPALRERSEDIPLLANYFLTTIATKESIPVPSLSKETQQLLQSYSWKGNIRELKNVISRALILVDGPDILPEHLPYEIQQQSTQQPGLSMASVEKKHIQRILNYTNGNKAKAARLLEIGLATLYRKMDEYQIPTDASK